VLAARFARDGQPRWAWYSRITGLLFAAGFAAVASGSGGSATVLAFTAAIVLGWAWLTAVSVKLYREV
jgi:O-antigen ligase